MIQTIGRAARNADGRVILYADRVTDSMARAMAETNRRRHIQSEHNKEHGIVPRTIEKPIAPLIEMPLIETPKQNKKASAELVGKMSKSEKRRFIESLTDEMREASRRLEYERAAELRDMIIELEGHF